MARLKVAGVTILTAPDGCRALREGLGIQGEKVMILPDLLRKTAKRKTARKGAKRTARAKRSSSRKRR